MVDITTRVLGDAPKNAPLTNQEVDQNFLNLKEKVEAIDQSLLPVANDVALVLSIALG